MVVYMTDFAKLASEPVFFEKNRVFRVYTGGKLFADFFSDDSQDSFFPEEWICSSVRAINEGRDEPDEGVSVVRGPGVLFDELFQREKSRMLGERSGLDVLVKALDSAIRLPVQAHPDKAFSQKYFNSSFGKAESWYVLATREDAAIYFGFKPGVTREAFAAATARSQTDKTAMESLLNRIPVKPGDVYFIPARAVHAIGAGCLILEVQEPTDFTIQPERCCGDYVLSDTEMYIGLKPEQALDCFDFGFDLSRVERECRKTPRVTQQYDGVVKESLITREDTPCFGVERYTVTAARTHTLTAPAVYVCTRGEGTVHLEGTDYSQKVQRGSYFFAPYSVNGAMYVQTGSTLELAVCLPPEVTH